VRNILLRATAKGHFTKCQTELGRLGLLPIKAVSKIGKEVKTANNENTDAIQMPFFEYLRPIAKSCRWAINKQGQSPFNWTLALLSKKSTVYRLIRKKRRFS
jgi:hypothetical protein